MGRFPRRALTIERVPLAKVIEHNRRCLEARAAHPRHRPTARRDAGPADRVTRSVRDADTEGNFAVSGEPGRATATTRPIPPRRRPLLAGRPAGPGRTGRLRRRAAALHARGVRGRPAAHAGPRAPQGHPLHRPRAVLALAVAGALLLLRQQRPEHQRPVLHLLRVAVALPPSDGDGGGVRGAVEPPEARLPAGADPDRRDLRAQHRPELPPVGARDVPAPEGSACWRSAPASTSGR